MQAPNALDQGPIFICITQDNDQTFVGLVLSPRQGSRPECGINSMIACGQMVQGALRGQNLQRC